MEKEDATPEPSDSQPAGNRQESEGEVKEDQETDPQEAQSNPTEEEDGGRSRVEEVGTEAPASAAAKELNANPGANINDSWGIFKGDFLDILGNGNLLKKIVKIGKGTRPKADQLVTLRTKGWLEDGTEIDCHDSITICLGDGDAVQAWDITVAMMEPGEIAIVITAPCFAHGEGGRDPDVPPNSLIKYEIELLEVADAPELKELSTEERCNTADQKREQGNQCFARADFPNAISSYRRAISFIEDLHPADKEERAKVIDMKVKCYNNLAAAQLKMDAYDAALKTCNAALSLDPNSVKALFRKGKVLANQLKLDEAIATMKKALLLEPANKTIHQELSKVTGILNKEKNEERERCQKMVGDMANIKELPAEVAAESQKSAGISRWILLGTAALIAIVAVLMAVLMQ